MNDKSKDGGEKEKVVDEIEVMLRRFGDEQSSLLDRFERLSFEVQLNQAILGRSLSDHNFARISAPPLHLPPLVVQREQQEELVEVHQPRRHRFGFQKVMKKFLAPILGKKSGGSRKQNSDDRKDLGSWKTFSRSFRI